MYVQHRSTDNGLKWLFDFIIKPPAKKVKSPLEPPKSRTNNIAAEKYLNIIKQLNEYKHSYDYIDYAPHLIDLINGYSNHW